MPGDYSRRTFDPSRHYSGVLKQQGRVDLDADHNELVEILHHRTNTETGDVVGLCGVPIRSNGFKIGTATGGRDLTIAPGRMYVGGLMCELEDPGTSYTTQPYYPKPARTTPAGSPPGALQLALGPGFYLAFIDAWQREINALDDPRIREVALGGPDTTTRLQTVWQVRLLQLFVSSPPTSPPGDLSCQTRLDEFERLKAPKTGLMNARTNPVQNQKDPCLLPPTAGFLGLENQLYRVQVHTGGDFNTATFKWSRNNATFESTIKNISGNIVTVAETGKDEFLKFAGNQWAEIVDPETELNSSPRPLVQIDSVNPSTGEITMKTSVAALAGLKNAKLRGWDQFGPSSNSNGVKMNLAQWNDLESGVQVSFSSGTYQAGDYWLIPARTDTADIEWPSTGAQPPVGIKHYYCKLALISVGSPDTRVIDDCRPLFPPLTNLTQLHYVSGDGQEGLPGQVLGFPLQVGVANGTFPVAHARVRFSVIGGTGSVISGTTIGASIVVLTGTDGVAECEWRLDAITKKQRVEATLLDYTTLPVRFNAIFEQAETQRGIHITAVRVGSRELRNDRDVSPVDLVRGIEIDCDEKVNPVTIIRPTCFVTLELPFPFNSADRDLWSNLQSIGFQPLILSADVGVKNEDTITWTPSKDAVPAILAHLFQLMDRFKLGDRVLVHLTLKGNFIWAAADPNLYLDGEVFGVQRQTIIFAEAAGVETAAVPGAARVAGDASLVAPLSPNIDISLRSGNGWKGGDFEMWFWLKAPVTASPNISVTPLTLDFGTIPTGQVPNLTTTISNIGTAPLAVNSTDIDNTASFQFVTSIPPFSLIPGGKREVTVHFSINGPPQKFGKLNIHSDDPDTPIVSVALVGPKQGPNIQVTPSSLPFGTVPAQQSARLPLIVTNTGTGLLDVGVITSNASVFKVIPPAGPFSLPPSATFPVTVEFTPTGSGAVSGLLSIPSNDPDQPTVSVPMTGDSPITLVAVPNIVVTPNPLVFGTVTPNGATLTVDVRNSSGDAKLNVDPIASDNPLFTVISPTTKFTLDPHSQQTVTVKFLPTAPGPQEGTLVVKSDDPDQPKIKVPMTGDLTPPPVPNIVVTPNPLVFGTVTPNGATLTVDVRNSSGDAKLNVDPIASDNPLFTVISPTTKFTLDPHSQQTVTVKFLPTAPGPQEGTLVVKSDDPDQPKIKVPMTGQLIRTPAPNIVADPNPLNFGDVIANGADLVLTVNNTGDAPLKVDPISSNNPSFIVVDPAAGFEVPGPGARQVRVHFTPARGTGKQTADLTINSNAPQLIVKATGKLKGL